MHKFPYNLVKWVGSLPNELRMVRLGSNPKSCYTQEDWSYFWKQKDVVDYCEKHYSKVGDLARELDVRFSMQLDSFVYWLVTGCRT